LRWLGSARLGSAQLGSARLGLVRLAARLTRLAARLEAGSGRVFAARNGQSRAVVLRRPTTVTNDSWKASDGGNKRTDGGGVGWVRNGDPASFTAAIVGSGSPEKKEKTAA
uniref:Uncharacterized protein n=1 Tax=Cucumis melo TaxID=3656 RepID=A0A9I9E3G6_CUCME